MSETIWQRLRDWPGSDYITKVLKEHFDFLKEVATRGEELERQLNHEVCCGDKAREERDRAEARADAEANRHLETIGSLQRANDALRAARAAKTQIEFTLPEIERLVEAAKVFIDKDDPDYDPETTVTVVKGSAEHHGGEGLYVFDSDYPDEGSVFLGNDSNQDEE